MLVRDTGIEPVTSSVSGKRSPAELIARDPSWRWRRESNPCARLCRPLPHHSATPPLGVDALHLRADDGIRTRDPHLGKVMRYQLRYIRAPRTTSSPVAKDDDSPRKCSRTNPIDRRSERAQNSRYASREIENPRPVRTSRHVIHDWALSQHSTPALIDSPYGSASPRRKLCRPRRQSQLARRVLADALPMPSSQSAGRAGGDQSRSMMSQRAQSASIMQLTLPDGEMKPVSWCTTRSPGAGPVDFSPAVQPLRHRRTAGRFGAYSGERLWTPRRTPQARIWR